jgi:hypothetical protein
MHLLEESKQLQKIGEQAAANARQSLLQAFRSHNLTENNLAIVAEDLLHATHQKVQWDAKTQTFAYSRRLTDNTTRYNTLKLLLEFFDAMPSKKVDVNDRRQTRELAGMLFEKLDKMGQIGMEDKTLPAQAAADEGELLSAMVEMRKNGAGGFAPVAYANLAELTDEDEDDDQ